jgi:hypothetical protein
VLFIVSKILSASLISYSLIIFYPSSDVCLTSSTVGVEFLDSVPLRGDKGSTSVVAFRSEEVLAIGFKAPVLLSSFVAFNLLASLVLLMSCFAFFTYNSFFYFAILALASSRSFSRFSKYSILFFLSAISASSVISFV